MPDLATHAAYTAADRQTQSAHIDTILATWCADKPASDIAASLQRANIAAAALAGSATLVTNAHLAGRAFWDTHDQGVLPALPWRMSLPRQYGPAPGLGTDTDAVLRDVLHIPDQELATLRQAGAFGV